MVFIKQNDLVDRRGHCIHFSAEFLLTEHRTFVLSFLDIWADGFFLW